MTIESRLAETRARVEAATEGPWEWAAHTKVDGDKWAVFHGESTSALAMNNDGWAPDAEFIAASRTDLPALLAAVEAVVARHRPMGIYDECQCESPSPEDGEHKRIDEVGVTCNRLYFVCRECCTDDGYQKEECANYHEHGLLGSNCPTVQALTAALEAQG